MPSVRILQKPQSQINRMIVPRERARNRSKTVLEAAERRDENAAAWNKAANAKRAHLEETAKPDDNWEDWEREREIEIGIDPKVLAEIRRRMRENQGLERERSRGFVL